VKVRFSSNRQRFACRGSIVDCAGWSSPLRRGREARKNGGAAMKPASFTYHDPTTVAEAVDLLARLDNARPLAGGQSLMPMMNFRLATPDHLVDLNKIGELAGIRHDGDTLRLGAMTRQRDVEFSPEIGRAFPILPAALRQVGHRQTRNRGTIGGSLCHLDSAAELVNLAALYDATCEVRSSTGSRELAFAEFACGYMTTGLKPDELLVAISFKAYSPRHGWAFAEVSRRHGDFAIAAVAVLVELDGGGAITRAALAISGLAALPARPAAIEAALIGQSPSHEIFRAAAAAAETLDAVGDAYAPAAYRRHLARILTYRALDEAAGRARAWSAQ
jgi:carbon-monoxide dehydrogenase medium subunit